MRAPQRIRQLDHRRRWARLRAPVWFFAGSAVIGTSAAALGVIAIGACAWAWSRVTDTPVAEVPIWGSTGWVSAVLALPAMAIAVLTVAMQGFVGTSRRVLRDVGARLVGDADAETDLDIHRFVNVVDALSIGLGVQRPELAVIEDPAPNALSVRWARHRVIAATRGLLQLPRAEIEAVCAHEMAHLHAVDARWITAAEATMRRVQIAGGLVVALGLLIVYLGFELDLWMLPMIAGAAIAVVGGLAVVGAGRAGHRIRREADTVADVAAILLARDPASLGAVCARLVADPRRVRRTSRRAAAAWFELIRDDLAPAGGNPDETVTGWLNRVATPASELRERAEAAYREARVPFAWSEPLPG